MTMRVFSDGEGHEDVRAIEIDEEAIVGDVIVAIRALVGLSSEGAVAFIEGVDAPLPNSEKARHHVEQGSVFHVHRVKEIDVIVRYGRESHSHRFKPATLVDAVLKWAVAKFKIDPQIAPEMELSLDGKDTALPRSAPIGRYVEHPRHELRLDLIRGVLPNG